MGVGGFELSPAGRTNIEKEDDAVLGPKTNLEDRWCKYTYAELMA
ncbi:MAG: hypothetical protein P0119_06320 [Nitrospira sp.]|nr:hypothetical protein [Nitrospira sp.]